MAYKLEISLENFSEKNFLEIHQFVKKLKLKHKIFHRMIIKSIHLPVKKKPIFTLLKSPHVHKKAREQFQFQIFHRKLIITNSNLTHLLYFYILIVLIF